MADLDVESVFRSRLHDPRWRKGSLAAQRAEARHQGHRVRDASGRCQTSSAGSPSQTAQSFSRDIRRAGPGYARLHKKEWHPEGCGRSFRRRGLQPGGGDRRGRPGIQRRGRGGHAVAVLLLWQSLGCLLAGPEPWHQTDGYPYREGVPGLPGDTRSSPSVEPIPMWPKRISRPASAATC